MPTGLKGKTLVITGASRGIGKAIALRGARDGANIVAPARTARQHPVLPVKRRRTPSSARASGRAPGHFYLDEDVMRATGERSFDQYAVRPGAPLLRDLFLDK